MYTDRLASLKGRLAKRREQFAEKKAANDYRLKEAAKCGREMEGLETTLATVKEASEFLVGLANARRGGARSAIEKAATDALRQIYGPDYRVVLEAGVKANRSSLDVLVEKRTDDGVARRGIEGNGGGVSDTVATPMRLMVLAASGTDKVAVLDECWKHLDANRIGSVGKLLSDISRRLGMQIVFATHHHALEKTADKVFEVRDDGGVSHVAAR